MPVVNRAWAMPCGDTLSIRPIAELIKRLPLGDTIVDPFARNSPLATEWSNDLNPATNARWHLDAEQFADYLTLREVSASAIIFDPPYSHRQCRELYESIGRDWLKDDQQQVGRWARLKDKLTALLLPGGLVVTAGWNSTGFGKSRGFEPLEYLLVNHGSAHNDTIVTVERFRGKS
jgi:hypothetical protein